MTDRDTAIREMTLMLMYLTSWEDGPMANLRGKRLSGEGIPSWRSCWKGYDFNVLHELTEAGLANAGSRAKSASLTDDGVSKAVELLRKYGISPDAG